MITVIMAGGSGTRLWPLSTPDYPKQLIDINGEGTLLQLAFRRAQQLTSTDKIYIIPEKSHAHHIRDQLPELPESNYIVEPGRRGTAGCIIAGLHTIQARHDHDEPIAFVHADHAIRDVQGFVSSFEHAAKASSAHQRLTLIGIEPTYPSTGLGYIHKGEEIDPDSQIYNVKGFKEKPDFELAKQYLHTGEYLWNCGYFVGSLKTFVDTFANYSPKWKDYYDQLIATTDNASYEKAYLSFEGEPIDYALMEPSKDLLVVPATFDWVDLGAFKDAHEVVDKDEIGNHVRGEGIEIFEVENSYIRNEETDKPIAVIGLDNVVVVNTKNGILVARKDLSQKVGDISKKIQANKQ